MAQQLHLSNCIEWGVSILQIFLLMLTMFYLVKYLKSMELKELDRFTLSCFFFVILALTSSSVIKMVSLVGMGSNEYTIYIQTSSSVYSCLANTSDIASYVLIQQALIVNCHRWIVNIMIQRGVHLTFKVKLFIETIFAFLFLFEIAFISLELYLEY